MGIGARHDASQTHRVGGVIVGKGQGAIGGGDMSITQYSIQEEVNLYAEKRWINMTYDYLRKNGVLQQENNIVNNQRRNDEVSRAG